MSQTSKPSVLQNFGSISKMFFRAMVGAYGLNLILYAIALILIGERWLVIEFLNTFAHILWLPTVILIPICLVMREWRLTTMMLPGLIGFVFVWGDMFIPNTETIPGEDDIPFRVLSYNMNAGNSRVDAYVNMITEIDADIVLLQELHYPQADILAQVFSEQYPFMAFHPGSAPGQGIMSRYPIEEDEYWQSDFLPHSLGHQRAKIRINDETSFVIYNVHPGHPGMQGDIFNPEYRSLEIADLLERTSQESLPVILAGDFNMPDLSEDYRSIRVNFGDTFRDAGYGMGWTFPFIPVQGQNLSFLRLDYIFYDTNFKVQNATIYSELTGSDHKALYADLFIHTHENE